MGFNVEGLRFRVEEVWVVLGVDLAGGRSACSLDLPRPNTILFVSYNGVHFRNRPCYLVSCYMPALTSGMFELGGLQNLGPALESLFTTDCNISLGAPIYLFFWKPSDVP